MDEELVGMKSQQKSNVQLGGAEQYWWGEICRRMYAPAAIRSLVLHEAIVQSRVRDRIGAIVTASMEDGDDDC